MSSDCSLRKTPVPSLAGGKAPEAGPDAAIQILYFCNTKQTFYKGLVSQYNIDAFYRGTTATASVTVAVGFLLVMEEVYFFAIISV